MQLMDCRTDSPRYFLFSDDPGAAVAKLGLGEREVRRIDHNRSHALAYADLWLMSHCRHFIIANSTFSWWGAWLGAGGEKIVMAPRLKLDGKVAWGFQGLIPPNWIEVEAGI
jgi:hypothetical protein